MYRSSMISFVATWRLGLQQLCVHIWMYMNVYNNYVHLPLSTDDVPLSARVVAASLVKLEFASIILHYSKNIIG